MCRLRDRSLSEPRRNRGLQQTTKCLAAADNITGMTYTLTITMLRALLHEHKAHLMRATFPHQQQKVLGQGLRPHQDEVRVLRHVPPDAEAHVTAVRAGLRAVPEHVLRVLVRVLQRALSISSAAY